MRIATVPPSVRCHETRLKHIFAAAYVFSEFCQPAAVRVPTLHFNTSFEEASRNCGLVCAERHYV
jgi:hypothetical protein